MLLSCQPSLIRQCEDKSKHTKPIHLRFSHWIVVSRGSASCAKYPHYSRGHQTWSARRSGNSGKATTSQDASGDLYARTKFIARDTRCSVSLVVLEYGFINVKIPGMLGLNTKRTKECLRRSNSVRSTWLLEHESSYMQCCSYAPKFETQGEKVSNIVGVESQEMLNSCDTSTRKMSDGKSIEKETNFKDKMVSTE